MVKIAFNSALAHKALGKEEAAADQVRSAGIRSDPGLGSGDRLGAAGRSRRYFIGSVGTDRTDGRSDVATVCVECLHRVPRIAQLLCRGLTSARKHLIYYQCVCACVVCVGPRARLGCSGPSRLHGQMSGHSAGHRLHPQRAHRRRGMSLSLFYPEGECVCVCVFVSKSVSKLLITVLLCYDRSDVRSGEGTGRQCLTCGHAKKTQINKNS